MLVLSDFLYVSSKGKGQTPSYTRDTSIVRVLFPIKHNLASYIV